MSASITVAIADGSASVTIDNPRQRNALTRALCIELQDLMPRLEADPDVVVVSLRGAGTTFSAGASIGELSSVLLDPQPDGTTVDHLSLADAAVTSLTKPTIALVDGACMGGGWQLASACDFIIASERSVLAITPAKLGVIYPRTGVERLVRQVGEARAKYIFFTGATFSAQRAEALGLIAESIPDSDFEARCNSIVSSIRDNSQFTVRTLKHLIDHQPEVDQAWASAWNEMTEGPDMAIGVAAFQARERPQFEWKPTAI
jgi:enoyl-CoA hydratase/carnithine racemase